VCACVCVCVCVRVCVCVCVCGWVGVSGFECMLEHARACACALDNVRHENVKCTSVCDA
jgi:hypothetical protein